MHCIGGARRTGGGARPETRRRRRRPTAARSRRRPAFAPSYRALGIILLKDGKKAEAASSFERYLELSPQAEDRKYVESYLRMANKPAGAQAVRRIAMVALCAALAGCIPAPARVDTPRTEGPDKAYTVDLPTGWIKQYTAENNLIVSRDGYLLQTLAVVRRPLKHAFERTKKDASDGMLPSELAELEIAEIKARDELTEALTVLENEPALVGGLEGFRVRVSYRNPRGLEIHEEVFGVVGQIQAVPARLPRTAALLLRQVLPGLPENGRVVPDRGDLIACIPVQSSPHRRRSGSDWVVGAGNDRVLVIPAHAGIQKGSRLARERRPRN